MSHVRNRRNYAGGRMTLFTGTYVLPARFFFKSESAVKNKVY